MNNKENMTLNHNYRNSNNIFTTALFLGYNQKEKFSFFATYNVASLWQIFARYDILQSNEMGVATEPWNNNGDGSLILGGLQFKPSKGVNLSLNYRTWIFKNSSINSLSGLYINLGFSI